MTDVNGGNVAVIVYREDEAWDTEVLPVALTEDLTGLIHALRQQPSIGGTIGLVAVGDDFFVALRVLGGQVSVFLSDLTAAVDWPLARQVLEYLDIPIPGEDDLDQVLPAGDMSIFADLGMDEMDLGALVRRPGPVPGRGAGQHRAQARLRPGAGPRPGRRARALSHAWPTGYRGRLRAGDARRARGGRRGDRPGSRRRARWARSCWIRRATIIGRGQQPARGGQRPHRARRDRRARAGGRAAGGWRLGGCTLVVTLEPCTMCAGAVLAARMDRLVYGAADPRAGAAGSLWDVLRDRRLGQQTEVIGGVLAEECARLLREFFAGRRRAADSACLASVSSTGSVSRSGRLSGGGVA